MNDSSNLKRKKEKDYTKHNTVDTTPIGSSLLAYWVQSTGPNSGDHGIWLPLHSIAKMAILHFRCYWVQLTGPNKSLLLYLRT